jgi:3-oxoadipate enol-lactonase/4-carboxymuconolactone decarboxylase
MPLVRLEDHRCFYRFDGIERDPVVMLSHSLGLDHGMWDQLSADLGPRMQVLRYDTRGHGASDSTPGDYSVEQLARDALGLAEALGIGRFAFCGLSLGGMVGQWLGVHASNRLTHLVLANTTPRLPEPQTIEDRRRTVLEQGMRSVADRVMTRFFSPPTLAAGGAAVVAAKRTLLSTDPIGYGGCCAAIRDMDQISTLGAIRTPTLVICGDADVAMPWEGNSEILVKAIAGSKAVHLPAAHLSNLERPRAFSAAVLEFLLPRVEDSAEAGTQVRRAVLGNEHVDRATAATTDFTRDFQELITRYAWGTIWTRPALDFRIRRLLVLAMTASMGRWEEFRLHVRTGLAADLEAVDLEEVLMQVAIYAGVPAANTAFQIAADEIGLGPSGKAPL